MSRSHPPTLLKLAERTIDDELGLGAGDVVLVAVSGGPDSMALLHVLARLLPQRKVHLVGHGVDHGLRTAAREELATAAELAGAVGVPFAVTALQVAPGSNLMARARSARYAALRAALESARPPGASGSRSSSGRRFIATGHHADDRAETVVIRLLRGCGPTGLAVLPPVAGDLVRPLIRARRSDIVAHLARHRIGSCRDPSNADPRFLRTRVRGELMPLLAELSPAVVEHLCGLADALVGSSRASAAEHAGPTVPAVIEGLKLGRAQRNLLERAFRAGNTRARVPLHGGAIARVDVTSSRIVLTKAR